MSASTAIAGRLRQGQMTLQCSIWRSAHSISTPATQTAVLTVFSCVASRNKWGRAAREYRPGHTLCGRDLAGRTPGRNSNSRCVSGVLRASREALRAARTQPNPPLKVRPALSRASSAHLVNAVRRMGWRRTARPKEPQELSLTHGPIHNLNLSGSALSSDRVETCGA